MDANITYIFAKDFCYGSISCMVTCDSLSLPVFKCKYDVGNNNPISFTAVLKTEFRLH